MRARLGNEDTSVLSSNSAASSVPLTVGGAPCRNAELVTSPASRDIRALARGFAGIETLISPVAFDLRALHKIRIAVTDAPEDVQQSGLQLTADLDVPSDAFDQEMVELRLSPSAMRFLSGTGGNWTSNPLTAHFVHGASWLAEEYEDEEVAQLGLSTPLSGSPGSSDQTSPSAAPKRPSDPVAALISVQLTALTLSRTACTGDSPGASPPRVGAKPPAGCVRTVGQWPTQRSWPRAFGPLGRLCLGVARFVLSATFVAALLTRLCSRGSSRGALHAVSAVGNRQR